LTLAADTNTTGLVSLSIARTVGPSYADGGVNLSGSVNPEGAAFLATAMASSDADEQCDALLSAQETILERVDMSPLIADTHYLIARAGFATYAFSGYWDMSAMRITS
ncbi:MAG: Peptide/nickel transport system substrate-binding protein, partial [Glaciihabitans sp.]|nr:Peptide/nickel transport system substrate-binding protein [Glaciihabitans sp.]